MTLRWIVGLWRNRLAEQLAVAAGLALAIALLSVLGVFFASSSATMTSRAVATVFPDWQVQVADGADPTQIAETLSGVKHVTSMSTVGFANLRALSMSIGNSEQTTGQAVAVGVASDYRTKFPTQFRILQGESAGITLAQQTAANLHVKPGDAVTLQLLDGTSRQLTVSGIVDMPLADSIFQLIGGQAAAAPRAPPDNIVIMPIEQWQVFFGGQLSGMPGTAHMQVHLGLDHTSLPPDPVAAFDMVRQLANNAEATLAGDGSIGNNLAVRLDGARSDALYMKVLFLFLGLPGAILAMLFSAAVITSGRQRHLREMALLKMRGIGTRTILWLAVAHGLSVAALGVAAGTGFAMLVAVESFGADDLQRSWHWIASAAGAGLALSIAMHVLPIWRSARSLNIVATLQGQAARSTAGLWQRAYLDLVLVGLALFAYWLSASTGYQVVVAPEGVPTASVDYKAFLAPVLLWIGAVLLLARLWTWGLGNGRHAIAAAVSPIAGNLAGPVSHFICQNQKAVIRGIALLALAFSFAVSTAIFNTTYERQAAVDAMLTNGADVTIAGTTVNPAGSALGMVRWASNVQYATTIMHRFAYVGNDLQDFYGINPATISDATAMSDAYFGNGDAAATLALLARTPDGVLVSDETVSDFQLVPGDTIKLRLQTGADRQYREVPFKFIGIVREFPTAPHDSFLVANAAYVAAQTGQPQAETILVKTPDDPAAVAAKLRTMLGGRGFHITDLNEAVQAIGSTLTAVDLGSLSRIQLIFALPLAAAAIGLVHLLSITGRRRSFVILQALGASARQRAAFRWSEALIIFIAGSSAGTLIGAGLAFMLIKMMTGVFDPPPEYPAVPWAYLGLLFALSGLFAAATVALAGEGRAADIPSGLKDQTV